MQIEVELNGRTLQEARPALLAILKETKPKKDSRVRRLYALISNAELKQFVRKKKR